MRRRLKIERWLEDLWLWMVKFKDIVFAIALEVLGDGIYNFMCDTFGVELTV